MRRAAVALLGRRGRGGLERLATTTTTTTTTTDGVAFDRALSLSSRRPSPSRPPPRTPRRAAPRGPPRAGFASAPRGLLLRAGGGGGPAGWTGAPPAVAGASRGGVCPRCATGLRPLWPNSLLPTEVDAKDASGTSGARFWCATCEVSAARGRRDATRCYFRSSSSLETTISTRRLTTND
ncbi:uncharacterized protein MICPUCDRAFT_52447 [Micromonas pusilla CCMP1545]|uniref:Predicted protein n=1 Tax=Micromonas pusilla (strain CCMP1545) TaxID=564608 RepID=C1N481_MICPC|nr:uncharacterized protein MICPUCDRAFT_52447 [Micromonas pusilla CCMP1545]EEH52891.1 predicted protein [Micromonas pusilla CCMP1545]|eukprot:XP_003062952.1 predicted protein [Micromonas pusilla CCMP1545]